MRRYSATGELVAGPHVLVDETESAPSVAADGHGRLSVAWTDTVTGEHSEVWLQRFAADGTPLSPRVKVSTGSIDYDYVSSVAASPDGTTVVAWRREPDTSDPVSEVWLRLFAPAGNALTPPFRASESTNGQRFGSVAMDGEGNFVVTWAEYFGEPRNDEVLFRRFDRNSAPLGGVEQANQYTDRFQSLPDVARDLAGNFAIAWVHQTPETHRSDLQWRAFRADGTPIGPEAPLANFTEEDQDSVSLALSEAGILVASWATRANDLYGDIHARRFVLPCADDGASLCLAGGRFLVRAQWRTADGGFGYARPRALDEQSGALWFFGDANLELVVKVLDGCAVNDHHWIYVAGLTDVETHLTVTDTWTGEIWSTETPVLTRFPPVQDIQGLEGCAASAPAAANVAPAALSFSPAAAVPEGSASGACSADAHHLCLQQNRFRVGATYRSAQGHQGPATAEPLEADTGAFRFFGPDNLELVVKVLDACDAFDRFWVYAAGLTDLEVELTVEDTASGAVRTYRNALGVPFVPVHDASAFTTCSSGVP
jgi:hypothetical protein